MEDIIDMLVQAVEENAPPLFYAKSEYRRKLHSLEQHRLWLEARLNKEARHHLAQLREAEADLAQMEHEALVKTALAAGVRLALPGALIV